MGSESSKSGINQFGGWEKGKRCCESDTKYQFVKKLSWADCQMTSDDIYFLQHIGRFATLYTSEFLLNWQDLTHDFIEAEIECSNETCKNNPNKNFVLTIEYGDGVSMNVGKYTKKFSDIKSFNPKSLSVYDLKTILNASKKYEKEPYDLINHNCKIYAESFYHDAEKMDKELDEAGEYAFLARGFYY